MFKTLSQKTHQYHEIIVDRNIVSLRDLAKDMRCYCSSWKIFFIKNKIFVYLL